MPSNFPKSLDIFPQVTLNTSMAASGYEHDLLHLNLSDAITAIETALGTTGSPISTTLTDITTLAANNIISLQNSVVILTSQSTINTSAIASNSALATANTNGINNLTITKLSLSGGTMTGELNITYKPAAVSSSLYASAQLLVSNTSSTDNPPSLGFQNAGVLGIALYLNASGLNAITSNNAQNNIITPLAQINGAAIVPGSIGASQLAANSVVDSSIATGTIDVTKFAPSVIPALTPSGVITMFGGASAPSGWLLCQGQSLATATYPALFTVIGYTYGGSGANFNIPNFQGNVPMGASASGSYPLGSTGGAPTATLVTANLPSHTHTLSSNATGVTNAAHATGVITAAHATGVTVIARGTGIVFVDTGHTHNYTYTPIISGSKGNWGLVEDSAFGYVENIDATSASNNQVVGYISDPTHTHGITDPTHTHIVTDPTHTHTVGATGSGTAFPILQPYVCLNFIIKT